MPPTDSRKIGLVRVLSKMGYCSRAQAATLIRAGRVTLNNAVRRNPETPVRIGRDRIAVDGQTIETARSVYLMMNKPRGLITTTSDEKGRDTVYSVLAEAGEPLPWVAPVGRLDKASEGLLLLTNDSEWAARLSSPESHLPKTYHVQIGAVATDELLREMHHGVQSEGDFLRALQCRVLRSGGKNSWVEFILDEGKNRHIRRMLAARQCEVLRLIRVAIGPLQLGDLKKGSYRSLTTEEQKLLDRALDRARLGT